MGVIGGQGGNENPLRKHLLLQGPFWLLGPRLGVVAETEELGSQGGGQGKGNTELSCTRLSSHGCKLQHAPIRKFRGSPRISDRWVPRHAAVRRDRRGNTENAMHLVQHWL